MDLLLNPNVLPLQLQPHCHHIPHRLDQLGMPMILPHPIFGTHDHQTVEDRVVPAMNVAIAPLFESPNGVSPEGVVIVEVIKGLVLPGIDIKYPLARTPIKGTTKDLQELSSV